MKKVATLLVVFFALSNCYSQEAYFSTGSNFTKYSFKSSNGAMQTRLQSGTGTNYEIGFSMPFKNDKFSYSLGVTLNEYNAVAGSLTNSYKWDTKYVGLQGALNFAFCKISNFQFVARGGISLSTIIYGKQELNSSIYDIKKQDEFSNLLVIPFAGLQTKYKLNEFGYLSVGYGISKSISPFNISDEKLSFTTNQITFGIHFNIDKK